MQVVVNVQMIIETNGEANVGDAMKYANSMLNVGDEAIRRSLIGANVRPTLKLVRDAANTPVTVVNHGRLLDYSKAS